MAQTSTPEWAPDLNPNPNAEAQRKRDAILHKAFDLRRQHEAQVAGGVSEKSCYDYVRDSVNTFKQNVDKNDIQHFHDTITRCGKVQSFGCFLAVHPVTLCVVACNSNTDKFLGKPWQQVLGSPIESLFNEPNKVKQILELQNIWVANPVLLSSGTEGKAFNAVVSLAAMRTKDQLTGEETDASGYLFEIEDTGTLAGDTQTEGLWQAHQLMRSAVARVQTCLSIEQIFSVAVEEIQKLSGLDRIMVYKFHPDMHGEVVEEYKQDYVKESLFGLHYPATDIPQIARELFKTNRVRHIMNIRDPGDDILCDSRTINPTDISLIKSVLRQPHACHLEYLQNMGSTASLTLAIVMDDKLWGLFACHHHGGPNQDNPQPLFVPYQKRAACEFLVQAICARIKSFIELAHHVRSEQRMNLHMGACERLTHFKSRDQFLKGLNGARGINLCDYIPHTTGAAVVLASSIHSSGSVPSDEMIRRILSIILPNNHMKKKEVAATPTNPHAHAVGGADKVVATECISDLVANTHPLAHIAAGLLSIEVPLSKEQQQQTTEATEHQQQQTAILVWFRPEFRNTVTYAGVPPADEDIGYMGPRASFAAFDQICKLHARAWSDDDKEAAVSLAHLVHSFYERVAHVASEGGVKEADGRESGTVEKVGDGDIAGDMLVGDILVRINAERVKTQVECMSLATDLTRLIDNANAPILGTDLEGRVTSWNRRCHRITGLSFQEVRGRALSSLCLPANEAVLQAQFAAVLRSHKADKFQMDVYTKERATTQQLLMKGSVRRDVDAVVDGLIFIGQDITETLKAIKTAQQLAEDYEQIFANAAIPIVQIDLEGKVRDWNGAMAKCSAVSSTQVVGLPLIGCVVGGDASSLLRISPADKDANEALVNLEILCSKALSGCFEAGLDVSQHFELSIRNGDGQLVDLLVSAAACKRYLNQEVQGVVLFLQDITERKTLEMASRMCLAAKAASAARTQQLSFLCHEIRNPLNAVLGYITFLEETRMTDEQEELVHTTAQCCLQLRRIVNDVLDLSSIEQGKLLIETAPFFPHDVINTVMSQVRVVMEDKDLAMHADIAPSLRGVELIGDGSRIMQILSNFAWNACKFTMEGSVTFRAEVVDDKADLDQALGQVGQTMDQRTMRRTQGAMSVSKLVFSVVDTGPGISKAVQLNLFQPFTQGDKSTTRHHGGTGLGLSICRQLAKLMGGDVSCLSTVGHGSSFQLILPMQLAPNPHANAAEEAGGAGGSSSSSGDAGSSAAASATGATSATSAAPSRRLRQGSRRSFRLTSTDTHLHNISSRGGRSTGGERSTVGGETRGETRTSGEYSVARGDSRSALGAQTSSQPIRRQDKDVQMPDRDMQQQQQHMRGGLGVQPSSPLASSRGTGVAMSSNTVGERSTSAPLGQRSTSAPAPVATGSAVARCPITDTDRTGFDQAPHERLKMDRREHHDLHSRSFHAGESSREGSVVGSLKLSVIKTMDMADRQYFKSKVNNSSSCRSLNDLNLVDVDKEYNQHQMWDFLILRERIDDQYASVLGELKYKNLRRQSWGSASLEAFGHTALEAATSNALATCVLMFPDLAQALLGQGQRSLLQKADAVRGTRPPSSATVTASISTTASQCDSIRARAFAHATGQSLLSAVTDRISRLPPSSFRQIPREPVVRNVPGSSGASKATVASATHASASTPAAPAPLPPPAASAAAAAGAELDAAMSEEYEDKPHILVVDDDSVNVKIVVVALRRAGMCVTSCTDGSDAVAYFEQVVGGAKKVDLVLMDMRMKVLNGDEAAIKIRAMEATAERPSVPIIALTGGGIGTGGVHDNEEVFRAGMQGLILKPLAMRSFTATVAQCLFHFSSDVCKVNMEARRLNPSKYRQSIVGDATILEP